jgi:hypothetical protein
MKCLLLLLLTVGLASSAPYPDDGPPVYSPPASPPAYAPAPPPKVYKSGPAPPGGLPYKEEENFPPQPYQFEYGVSDQYTGANFKAAETKDDKGTVLGE